MLHGPRTSNRLYLTFDDGPHPEFTPRLLDLLAEQAVMATFFLIGQKAERHPDIVRRMIEEGHTIGNHTWSHSAPHLTSAKSLIAEVTRTNQVLTEITGVTPILFRPPHGKLTIRKVCELWKRRYSVVLWNVDPKDFSCTSAPEAMDHLTHWQSRAGDIVLLHDIHPHSCATVELLTSKIRQQQPGIDFLPLGALLPAYRTAHVLAS